MLRMIVAPHGSDRNCIQGAGAILCKRRPPAAPATSSACLTLGLAEGTETALSAMMLAGMSVWVSLGVKRLQWAGDSADAFFAGRGRSVACQRASQRVGLVPSVA
jgi:hypothetical protein